MIDYLEEFLALSHESCFGARCVSPFSRRDALCRKYAWAIPSPEALDRIAALGPIVEIGAGTGYWAYLLGEMGVDVLAYDINPPGPGSSNHYHKGVDPWTEVLQGGPEQAIYHPERTLLLCWPPYETPMAYEALRAYRGNTVVYIGEGEGGCTGDDSFHDLLHTEWTVEQFDIPTFDWIHDSLHVCTRKALDR